MVCLMMQSSAKKHLISMDAFRLELYFFPQTIKNEKSVTGNHAFC